MILKSLKIEMEPSYMANAGQYTGKAVFASPNSEISIILTHEASQNILRYCADGIVDVAIEVSKAISAEIINEVKSLDRQA